jgi:RHS repeat-associated protein
MAEQRKTNGVTKQISYDYNENGSLKFIQYPSGLKIDYAYDNAGRAVEAKDLAGSVNYAWDAKYSGAGSLCSVKNGAGITSTFTFTSRLQPARLHVTNVTPTWNPCDAPAATGTIEDFVYAFNHGTANNGNVASVTNNRDASRSLTYTYDELNRIDLASTQATSGANCWGLDHGYDLWGNLLSIAKKSTHMSCAPTLLTVAVSVKNQISDAGFVYDAAGNLINTPNPGGLAMQYDAENRMTSAAGVTYTYDGDGKRVQKSNGKLYWYGTSSDPLFETDAAGAVTDEYIFFGGKRTARKKSSGEINYYFADHLGSSRVVASATGSILDDSDFYPFGIEVPITSSTDNPYLFTGKERDSESGLDYFGARHFAAGIGRFHIPDPGNMGAEITDPQSWNAYSYVINNPLNGLDSTGEDYYLLGGKACGDGVDCDEDGFVLTGDGERAVVTDDEILSGRIGASLDANGNMIIKTGQGEFVGVFFDPKPLSIRVELTYTELKLMILPVVAEITERELKVDLTLMAGGAAAQGATGAALAGLGKTATAHGAMRMADPSRLGWFGRLLTKMFPTAKYVQADGARVFVRAVGGKYDVVIENPATGKVITVLKTISQKALDNLAKNYGWTQL